MSDLGSTNEILSAILSELRSLRAFAEEKENPSHKLAGWVGSPDPVPGRAEDVKTNQPARASVVDFCKRIEFCFKDHPAEFIDFRATASLVEHILREHGAECLRQFTAFCETRYESTGRSVGRPERMRNIFQSWLNTF